MSDKQTTPETTPTTEEDAPKRSWKKGLAYVGGAVALLTAGALISQKLKDSDSSVGEIVSDVVEDVTE